MKLTLMVFLLSVFYFTLESKIMKVREVNRNNGIEKISRDGGQTWQEVLKIKRIVEKREDGKYASSDRGFTWTKVGNKENILLKRMYNKGDILYFEADLDKKSILARVEIVDLYGNKLYSSSVVLSDGKNSFETEKVFTPGTCYIVMVTLETGNLFVFKNIFN